VAVVPYNPAWSHAFEAERARLRVALAPWLQGGIHHIGSTAVPGLSAKPIIDMLAGVQDLNEARKAFEPLAEQGYEYLPHRPEAHRFQRTGYHLHLTQPGSQLWRERLAFRDALLESDKLRGEYAEWKRVHAARCGETRPYTASKWSFVARVLADAGIELKPDAQRLSAAELARRL
jgi:GrpB-like predicted nucleotidyltransferase (UPF0157 family)